MHSFITSASPLIFAFHGAGGDAHQFVTLVCDLWPAAGLVAPRGEMSEHSANWFLRCTGEGRCDMADFALHTETLVKFVCSHRASGVPAYAFGYSNGANILAPMSFSARTCLTGSCCCTR